MNRISSTAWLALAFLVAMAPACSSPSTDCPKDERFTVKVDGTCGMPASFTIASAWCRLTLDAAPSATGLPSVGGLGETPQPIREGGWLIYGVVCLEGEKEPCRDGSFRVCRAKRNDWQLDLSCFDDGSSDTPSCQARLTE